MIHQLSFPEAINMAMSREMEADPTVFAFGIDLPDHKRTFGSGKGNVLDLPEIDLSGEVFNEYEQRFKGPF